MEETKMLNDEQFQEQENIAEVAFWEKAFISVFTKLLDAKTANSLDHHGKPVWEKTMELADIIVQDMVEYHKTAREFRNYPPTK